MSLSYDYCRHYYCYNGNGQDPLAVYYCNK